MSLIDFKVATFNVQNLFDRVRVFASENWAENDKTLEIIDTLRQELEKTVYDKPKILELYQFVAAYIEVSEDRGKLFQRNKSYKPIKVTASGKNDWDGSIVFKRKEFSDKSRSNTAEVIKRVNADIICLTEVESRPTLDRFYRAWLEKLDYEYSMVIDGNDPRGIDIGILSRYPIEGMWTHIFDKDLDKRIFSRDCLEIQIRLPNNKPLYLVCNHFVSRSRKKDSRRKLQADTVRRIITDKYDLSRDLVIVCGDFNDAPNRYPYVLKELLNTPRLSDILKLQFDDDFDQRWTYYFNERNQIDYILVSEPLRHAFQQAGVERRGIYNLKEKSGGIEKSFKSVTRWTNAASDHGAVWAKFSLNI